MRVLVLLLLVQLCPHPSAWCFESYDLIEALIPKGHLARVLNSTDLDLRPNDPQPLFTPTGDFNSDGIEDMTISGIYDLPLGKNKYFLLVGTQYKDPVHYQSFLFKEYEKPVFLHKPGSTGDKDPGDQAFSITFCSDCSEGLDFYWNKKKQRFDERSWVRTVRQYQPIQHAQPTDLLTPETIDKALKIVGELADVKIFVAGLKKSGGKLATRVEPAINRPSETIDGAAITQVNVSILEKKKKGEVLYDKITVDTATESVLKRRRSVKGKSK